MAEKLVNRRLGFNYLAITGFYSYFEVFNCDNILREVTEDLLEIIIDGVRFLFTFSIFFYILI